MSGFDNRKQIKFSADAPSFSAVITPGTAVQTAVLTWKKGWKVGAPSVTTSTMDQLMEALSRLDAGVKFYKRGEDAGTLSAADTKALEAMRLDVGTVSDAQYRSACRQFKQPIQPRPTQAATGFAQAQQVNIIDQLAAWPDFQREHGEIFQPPFGDSNVKIIAQYLMDEGNLPSTPANLEQAYRECSRLGYFRDARVLTRGMGNDFRVVRPYNHAEVLASRRQQVADVANQPPVGLSDVDRDCWRAVHQAYPQLPVNSPAFKKCCADTLQKWAFEHVAEEHPDWFTTNAKGQLESAASKRAEVRAAVDRVITAWVRAGNPNLGQGNKTIRDTRIWLG